MSLNDKVVLITGGTGSFGKKFTEIVLREFSPKKLIVFSRDELKQYEMNQKYSDSPMRYFIGDVRDSDRLKLAFQGVDVVVHAAAMKQVPICEYNPFEAVKTNVFGAQNVIEAAINCGVQKVLAISTDKAVNPINLYGATKLCAEKLFVQSNSYSGENATRFSCARYGNVVGSRGSVIPVFIQQRELGRITVTDKRMTRFNITLQQGVDFVLQCLNKMWGGELFVPKIPSYRITDVAKAINPECKLEIVGIRPGEKLHEEMITKTDALNTVEFDDYYVILPTSKLSWDTKKFIQESNGVSGKIVTENFCYNSGTNINFLSVEELRSLIKTELYA